MNRKMRRASGKAPPRRPERLQELLQAGLSLAAAGQFAAAEQAFREYLAHDPEHPQVLMNLGNMLRAQSRLSAAEDVYRRAAKVNPGHADVHFNLGALYRQQGRIPEALAALQAALDLNPHDAETRRTLASVMQRLIQPWHFEMLADNARNEAYDAAIRRAVTPASRVLDIGTGSGLLALMAARAGAAEVTSCEMLKPLAEAARQIVAENGYSDRIRIINKKSTELRVGVDLVERADVLISEILDGGLLGEGILPVQRHALQHLATSDAKVVPMAATIWALPVEMPARRRVTPMGSIAGFDLSAFNRFRDPGAAQIVALESEPHKALAEPARAFEFDFRHPSAERQADLEIPATASGLLQAVAFWFELHLDAESSLSSGPGGALKHWYQALQVLAQDVPVQEGGTIRLSARHNDQRIYFEPAVR